MIGEKREKEMIRGRERARGHKRGQRNRGRIREG